ncbi:unnamed protein product [Cercospora beticola]|nr:unnamed protein product [Cercospora beticola]
MRVIFMLPVVIAFVHALPIARLGFRDASTETSSRQPASAREKRQYQWNWTVVWGTTLGPSTNPFDLFTSEQGKQLAAECSGGSYEEQHSSYDGYYTDYDKGSFVSWHVGPPNNSGWNPFASRVGSGGLTSSFSGGSIGGSRPGTTVNGASRTNVGTRVNNDGASTNVESGGGQARVNDSPKSASNSGSNSGGDLKLGCLNLGIASLGLC